MLLTHVIRLNESNWQTYIQLNGNPTQGVWAKGGKRGVLHCIQRSLCGPYTAIQQSLARADT